jgi:hypothetical protein
MSRNKRVVERAAGAHNLVIALISYMFGVLVFLPMAKGVGMPIFEIVISSLVVIVVSSFLYMGFPFIDTIAAYVTHVLSDWWVNWKNLDESESSKTYRSIHLFISFVFPFLLWWFFSPLLKAINPALSGLMLIIVLLFTLYLFLMRDAIGEKIEVDAK